MDSFYHLTEVSLPESSLRPQSPQSCRVAPVPENLTVLQGDACDCAPSVPGAAAHLQKDLLLRLQFEIRFLHG